MIRATLLSLAFMTSMTAIADCNKPIRIAVIDTGFGYQGRGINARLCEEGHRDFSADQIYASNFHTKDQVPLDMHGHGTNIVGIIGQYANSKYVNYCFIIIKFYSTKNFEKTDPKLNYELANEIANQKALAYLNYLKPDIVNYSGGGSEYDPSEARPVRQYLDSGGIFVAAAGNNNQNLDEIGTYYPAMCDKRIIVVGSANKYGTRSQFSNYGKVVKRWENGEFVQAFGLNFSGTSQATAIETGKIVGQLNDMCVK